LLVRFWPQIQAVLSVKGREEGRHSPRKSRGGTRTRTLGRGAFNGCARAEAKNRSAVEDRKLYTRIRSALENTTQGRWRVRDAAAYFHRNCRMVDPSRVGASVR
jgi:hypothetical protein